MTETYEHEERFWSKVDASASCWVWTGASAGNGYGKLGRTVNGKTAYPYAHRYAYELLVGPIPGGLVIDHLCKNRKCVNPDHLEAVTQRSNVMRSAAPTSLNARKTHCNRGHEYSEENTYHGADGRACRACHRMWDRARHKKGGRRG